MQQNPGRRLRPLGVADLLDETVELYKSNFKLLIGIAAFLYVPYFLLTSSSQQPNPRMGMGDVAVYAVKLALALLFFMVASPIVTGALTLAVSDRYLGRDTSIGTCYRRMLKASVILPFVWMNILAGLAMMGAAVVPAAAMMAGGLLIGTGSAGSIGAGAILILLGLAAIALPLYVYGRLALVTPVFMLEMAGAIDSMKRCWQLAYGGILRILGVVILTGIVVSIVQAILATPASLLFVKDALGGGQPSGFSTFIYAVFNAIAGTIMMPITSIVLILLYYDLRVRKEGFDLELLAQELDARSRDVAAHGPSLPEEQLAPRADIEEM